MIQMYHASKVYSNGVRALDNINVNIEKGEFVFLMGPSGAGKSTFMKLIFREELPTTGQVIIDGRNIERLGNSKIPFLRRGIGIVFQDFKLLKNKTAFDNVAFALRVIGIKGEQLVTMTNNALEQVGLLHKKNSYPDELSGGEQQRICIARAIVNEPAILLTDEPTGNLDHEISMQIMNMFLDINRRGTTIIIATHNNFIVDKLKKRVIMLENGKIVDEQEEGTYSYGFYE